MRKTLNLGLILVICAALLIVAAPSKSVTAQSGGTTTTASVTHVVQPGENLFRIALKYGVTVQAIAQANNITNPNIIFIGQSLTIPGGTNPGGGTPPTGNPPTGNPPPAGTTYTVVAGDNLSKIARQFSTTVQAIAQANSITNVNLVFVGQVLNIPAGTGTPPTGGTGNPPGTGTTGTFELGGHVAGLDFGHKAEMQQAGMKWAKIQIRYKRGDNADITAPAINAAHLSGFKVLLSIIGDKNELANTNFETYTDDFANFLGGVAGLGPEAIEVWNEQNLDREWPNGQINPTNYTTMLRKGYEKIKAANSNVLVISGAPAPTGAEGAFGTAAVWNDDRYIRGMAQAGAANYMDCVGAHYNEGIISPTRRSGDPRDNGSYYTRYYFGMLDTYYNAFGGARPVCFTELGFLSFADLGTGPVAGFEWAKDVTVQQHAIYLGEAAQLSRSSGRVRLMIVWNVDFDGKTPDPTGGFAIIRPDDSCPACTTLGQAMQ